MRRIPLKTHVFLACLAILFLAIPQISRAAARGDPQHGSGGPVWGCVNQRLLILLHPDMASFDFARGLFFRLDPLSPRGVSPKTAPGPHDHDQHSPGSPMSYSASQEMLEKLNQAWEKLSPRLKPLLERRNQINSSFMTNLLRRESRLQEFPLPTSRREITADELASRVAKRREIEAEFTAKLQETQSLLRNVEQDMQGMIREAEQVVYLSPDESFFRFQRIVQDINAQAQAVAEQQKIDVVFDSSYGKRHHTLDPELPLLQSYNEAGNAMVCDLFHFLINWRLSRPSSTIALPEGREVSQQAFNGFLFSLPFGRRAAQCVGRNPYLTGPILSFSSETSCLSGFQDITPQVAQALLARYSIPEEMKNSLVLFLRDFVEFKRDAKQQMTFPSPNPGK